MKKSLLIIVISILLTAGYYVFSNSSRNVESEAVNSPVNNLVIGEKAIKVDFAATEGERSQGLSGRETLEANTGLLFIFDKPGKYGFWMKDMNFPIDIVWINSEKEVSSCEENVTPESYPKTFYPDGLVQYALEVPAGSCTQWDVSSGIEVSWEQ